MAKKFLDCNGQEIKPGDKIVHAVSPSHVWTVVDDGQGGLQIEDFSAKGLLLFTLEPEGEHNLSSVKYRRVKE